jgi:hypothetical protein
LLSVSVSVETYIRKDAGFENSASTARSELGRIGSAAGKGVRGTVPASFAVFHWRFCRKPGVKIPLLAKMAVYISHKTRAKHTLPFLRARTPFPSATANPTQFRRAFTILLWGKFQGYGGEKQLMSTYEWMRVQF